MTDYGSMSHQQMYDFVHSGNPSTVQSEADNNTQHAQSVTDATQQLQTTLSGIQASWSGTAADQFSQQANALVDQMSQHAANADTIAQVMDYAGSSLSWAQKYMPSPPSEAEQLLADIDSNAATGIIGGLLTGGAANLASEAAKQDIANKKQAATQVMTQLASAYFQAQSQLPSSANQFRGDPPPSSHSGNQNSNDKADGSTIAAPIIYPMPIGSPGEGGEAGGTGHSGGEGAYNSRGSGSGGGYGEGVGNYSGYGGGGNASGGGYGGVGGSGGGMHQSITDPILPPSTVTSGLSGGTTGTGGVGGGYSIIGGGSGNNSPDSGPGVGTGNGLSSFSSGGIGGASDKFGTAGLTRPGGFGGGIGTPGGAADIGEEAGGTGYGSQASLRGSKGTGSGSSSANRITTSASPTAGEGENPEQMGGMMGGMGRGAGGSGKDDRGSRASWLKEDRDYWYGDKYKNATPPGGIIE